MEGGYILSGLHRKRSEIAGRLAAAQAEAARLAKSLEAVEATIRLFAPDAEMPALRASPTAPRNQLVAHGDLTRSALDTLRTAGEPLSTRLVASRVMEACALDGRNPMLVRTVHKRIGTALRDMRERAVVASEGREDGQTWWRIA